MATETITLRLIAQDLASGNISKAIGKVDKLAQRGGLMGSVFQGVGIQMGMMLNPLALMGRGLHAATDFMGDAIQAASDLEESQAKVEQVFTESADAIGEWAEDSARAFGLSEQAALEAAGTFGNFIQALGNSEQEANRMSRSIVELAADLASFNNQEIDDVIVALRSGLAGEAEPMRRLGVSLSAARVEAYILAKGMAAAKSKITDAMKVTARYALIMEDTTKAQGDFERTSEGAANQARTLAGEADNLSASIGEKLLPYQKAWNVALLGTLDLLDQVLAAAEGGDQGTVGNLIENERDAMREFERLASDLGVSQDELADRIWATGESFRSYAAAMAIVTEVGRDAIAVSSEQILELGRARNAMATFKDETGETVVVLEDLAPHLQRLATVQVDVGAATEYATSSFKAERKELQALIRKADTMNESRKETEKRLRHLTRQEERLMDRQAVAAEKGQERKVAAYQAAIDKNREMQDEIRATIALTQQLADMKTVGVQFSTNAGAIFDKIKGLLELISSTPGTFADRHNPGSGPASSTHVPGGATGAIVRRPTLALIGERGPEAVVPLSKTAGNSALPAGGGITINVGYAHNARQFAEDVGPEVVRYMRRAGVA